jgi:RNA recognition motif-containing protein
MKNIYVGNLDFNASEEQVRALFEQYGSVDNVTLVRDRDTGQPRGFGFVEMTNDEEAEKAISATNGTMLGGRNLNVSEARPKTERAGGGGGGRGGYGGGGGGGRGRGAGGGGGGRGGYGGGGGGGRGGGGGGRY